MADTTLDLRFGLPYVVPAAATAAWGCRAIVTQQGGVDFVYDRQDAAGQDEPRQRLLALLAERLPSDELRHILRTLLVRGWMQTREAEDFILYMDDDITVHANTNASAGYCYVTAWLIPATLTEEPTDPSLCPWQTAYGLPWSEYCGASKDPVEKFCRIHMSEMEG